RLRGYGGRSENSILAGKSHRPDREGGCGFTHGSGSSRAFRQLASSGPCSSCRWPTSLSGASKCRCVRCFCRGWRGLALSWIEQIHSRRLQTLLMTRARGGRREPSSNGCTSRFLYCRRRAMTKTKSDSHYGRLASGERLTCVLIGGRAQLTRLVCSTLHARIG